VPLRARADEPTAHPDAAEPHPDGADPHDPRGALDVESDGHAADQSDAGAEAGAEAGAGAGAAAGAEAGAAAGAEAGAAAGAEAWAAEGGTLQLRRAITIAGMGCRSGGTVLHFGVTVGPEVEGELLEPYP